MSARSAAKATCGEPDHRPKAPKSGGSTLLRSKDSNIWFKVSAPHSIKDDPYVLHALGESASEIGAARQQLLANVDRIFDLVDAGKEIDFATRAQVRRDQIRSAWRAVRAADDVFDRVDFADVADDRNDIEIRVLETKFLVDRE